jgi:RNA polymerase subunit RPABC4/transcription elongation factor Spt4
MVGILLLEGIVMDPETQIEMEPDTKFCPECGAEESGYFCRSCGILLRGQDDVLCPRCHRVVPGGDFCNQCGQNMGGIALNLRQLALAGDDFWVTAAAAVPAAPPGGADAGVWEPDESVVLADADLPEWLQELPTESAPAEVQAHVYPSLKPIEEEREFPRQGRLFTVAILLLGLLLLALMFTVVFLLVGGGG